MVEDETTYLHRNYLYPSPHASLKTITVVLMNQQSRKYLCSAGMHACMQHSRLCSLSAALLCTQFCVHIAVLAQQSAVQCSHSEQHNARREHSTAVASTFRCQLSHITPHNNQEELQEVVKGCGYLCCLRIDNGQACMAFHHFTACMVLSIWAGARYVNFV